MLTVQNEMAVRDIKKKNVIVRNLQRIISRLLLAAQQQAAQ